MIVTKPCAKCGIEKPLDSFHISEGRRKARCAECRKIEKRAYYLRNRERILAQASGYRAENADRIREQQAGWRAENKDALKRRNFEKNYGITWEQREAMLAAQNGCCAICKSESPGKQDWHMDHDHSCCPAKARSCGACVRGLLCSACNVMLGCAKDSESTLSTAIEYLRRSR